MNDNSASLPADPGYAFAAFRSHGIHLARLATDLIGKDWYAPGFDFDHGYRCGCACGKFRVSPVQHFHSGMDGLCHALERCV